MVKTILSGRSTLIFLLAFALLSGVAFLTGASMAANQAAPANVNLYQEVMAHKAGINWQNSPGDNYPDDACTRIAACSADRSAPKVFVLPVTTIDGRRTARAVYLVKTKDPKEPETVVFEHQNASQTYFFRLAPDGSILHTAYLESGKPWLPIANQLGQPIFNKDAPDWHAALAKVGAKAGR
jgi:hypothetical protein